MSVITMLRYYIDVEQMLCFSHFNRKPVLHIELIDSCFLSYGCITVLVSMVIIC